MRRHYTAEQRTQLVDLVTSGRATVSQAAARLDVGTSTASYWVRRAIAEAGSPRQRSATAPGAKPPTFVRLVREREVASIEVRIGGAMLHVTTGFDADLLRAVVAALREGAA
jgi:transposase-like protein